MSKVAGTIEADDLAQARHLLREQALIAIRLEPQETATAPAANASGGLRLGGGVRSLDVQAFLRTLHTQLSAGLSLAHALDNACRYTSNRRFQRLLQDVRQMVLSGQTLADAMACYPGIFDEVTVNIVRAGEVSGKLDVVLPRLVERLRRAEVLRRQLTAMMAEPLKVFGALLLFVLVILYGFVPVVDGLFPSMGQASPLAIQGVMLGRHFLVPGLAAGLLTVFLFYNHCLRQGPLKGWWDEFLSVLPLVGPVVEHRQCAHFVGTLEAAYGAGVPLVDGVSLAAETMDNHCIREAYRDMVPRLRDGYRLEAAVADNPYLPDVVRQLLVSGEEAGNLEKTLAAAGKFLEEEIAHHLEVLMGAVRFLLRAAGFVAFGAALLAFFVFLFGTVLNSIFSTVMPWMK